MNLVVGQPREKLDKEAFLEFAEKWGYKVNVCDTAEDEDD